MYGKLVVFLCAAALASAGYSGPPSYGYDPAVSAGSFKSESYKSQLGTFGPVASNSGFKTYSGPTITPVPTPVPGTFTTTTKNGNPVSAPSYPALQYSTLKSKAVSLSYNNPTAAYPTQSAGVIDYPASYSSQNYAQYPQAYTQSYPQAQVYQAYPQAYSQAIPQAAPQDYAYQGQAALPGYQAYSAPSQYQAYSAQPQYQAYQAPTQYQAYEATNQQQVYQNPTQNQIYQTPTQYQVYQTPTQNQVYHTPTQNQAYQAPTQIQAYSTPAQYPGYPSGYPAVQYSSPVQYSSAPAVSHVQYSGNDGSYSWKKK